MTVVQITSPTRSEVDAAEKVLAEAHGMKTDGYWRALAESALEAARDARLQEFIAEVDREFDRVLSDARFDEERARA